MTRQKQIIAELSKKFGISNAQGTDVYECIGKMLSSTIHNTKIKDEQGFIDKSKMPVITIPQLGKFIPKHKTIKFVNCKLEKKLKEQENEKH